MWAANTADCYAQMATAQSAKAHNAKAHNAKAQSAKAQRATGHVTVQTVKGIVSKVLLHLIIISY